jgi:hypothetical protein
VIMRSAKIILCVLSILSLYVQARRASAQTPQPRKRVVISVSALRDGEGRLLRDTRVVIEGPKVVAIDPKAGRWTTTFNRFNHTHFSLLYSFFASIKIGSSASASFHNRKKSS